MQINGKEIGFRFTIGARLEIAALCPEKKWENFVRLFGTTEEEAITAATKLGIILNHYYEMNLRIENGEPVNSQDRYNILTESDVMNLTPQEFPILDKEITETIFGDALQTVEAEESKNKGKKTGKRRKGSSSTEAGSSSTDTN